jgi:hypothetical protein
LRLLVAQVALESLAPFEELRPRNQSTWIVSEVRTSNNNKHDGTTYRCLVGDPRLDSILLPSNYCNTCIHIHPNHLSNITTYPPPHNCGRYHQFLSRISYKTNRPPYSWRFPWATLLLPHLLACKTTLSCSQHQSPHAARLSQHRAAATPRGAMA